MKLIRLITITVLLGLPYLGFAQQIGEITANLRSPIVKTRVDAARTLGERRQREAAGPLAEALRTDTSADVKKEAVRALGLIKVEEEIPAMIGALNDPDEDVRKAAVLALVSFYVENNIDFVVNERKGWNIFNPFLDTHESTIVDPLIKVDPRIIEGLVGVAGTDIRESVRIAAIKALGVLRATSAIPQLGTLSERTIALRVDILRTFIKLGDPSADKYVIPLLDTDDDSVREHALSAAGLLRIKAAVPKLIEVYNHPKDSDTATMALEALSLIGDRAAENIFSQNLNNPSKDMRRLANEGLARLGDKNYLQRIQRDRIQEKDNRVRLAQAFALYKLGRTEFMEAIFQELESGEKDQASSYLVEVQPKDLYPFLLRGSVETRRRVVEALGRIGDRDAVAKIKPLLGSSDRDLVNAANMAIQQIERREKSGAKTPAKKSGLSLNAG